MSVLEFILRHMMVFLEDILMKVFLISPFYPEEWSLMRVINTFLLWCALIFLVCRGIAGMVFLLGGGRDFSGRVLDPAGRRENVGMKYSSSCGGRFSNLLFQKRHDGASGIPRVQLFVTQFAVQVQGFRSFLRREQEVPGSFFPESILPAPA